MRYRLGKKKRIRLGLTIGALLLLPALLLTYLSVFTLSKYRNSMTGYTNFDISSFHAVLLGNMTEEEVRRSWTDSTAIRLFGEDVRLDIMQPGVAAQSVPFSLANGTAEDNISSMDFDYVLRVRTTGNIPLKFVLKQVTEPAQYNEEGVEISSAAYREFRSAEDYYMENEREGDAPRYIYPLYEVQTDESGVALKDAEGNYLLASQETTFTMSGGILQLQQFILEIEWPIEAATEDAVASNDQKYMKEVDVVDMLANVTSANRAETSYGDNPAGAEHTFYAEGMLVVYPSAEKQTRDGTEYYMHQFEYRAFRASAAVNSSAMAEIIGKADDYYYSYPVYVSNGNNLYRNGQRIADNTTLYTDFQVTFGIPMTEDTLRALLPEGAAAGSEAPLREYVFCAEDDVTGALTVLSTAVTYRSYNLVDGTYTEITADEANEILTAEDPAYEYRENNVRIYAMYTVTEETDETQPKTFRLVNEVRERIDATHYEWVTQFDRQKFRIYILGGLPRMTDAVNNSQEGLSDTAYAEALASEESRMFMEVTAVYSGTKSD